MKLTNDLEFDAVRSALSIPLRKDGELKVKEWKSVLLKKKENAHLLNYTKGAYLPLSW